MPARGSHRLVGSKTVVHSQPQRVRKANEALDVPGKEESVRLTLQNCVSR
jgi:hypothetical protein